MFSDKKLNYSWVIFQRGLLSRDGTSPAVWCEEFGETSTASMFSKFLPCKKWAMDGNRQHFLSKISANLTFSCEYLNLRYKCQTSIFLHILLLLSLKGEQQTVDQNTKQKHNGGSPWMCGQHNVRATARYNRGQNTKVTHPVPGYSRNRTRDLLLNDRNINLGGGSFGCH